MANGNPDAYPLPDMEDEDNVSVVTEEADIVGERILEHDDNAELLELLDMLFEPEVAIAAQRAEVPNESMDDHVTGTVIDGPKDAADFMQE